MSKTGKGRGMKDKLRALTRSNIFRFGLAAFLLAAVVIVLARQIDPSEIEKALKQSNLWWIAAAAGAGALSWVAAAIPLKALANIKVPFWDAILVQVSSSFVGVVAPMGLGPMGMHIDYLRKRGGQLPIGVAIVATIELSQFAGFILILGVALLIDHKFPHVKLPFKEIFIVAGILAVVIVVLLFFQKVRTFLGGKISEYWGKIRPELVFLRAHPWSLVAAVVGSIFQTLCYASAMLFSLLAVGHPISLAMAITVFLIGNTIGSAVPVPGGIGSTLAATVAALHLAGVPTALGATATVLFRLTTFYVQVPVGAGAYAYMKRKNLL